MIKYIKPRNILLVGISLTIVLIAAGITTFSVKAIPSQQYSPPTQITLSMYQLNRGNGSIFIDPQTLQSVLCTSGSKLYGCTYFASGADAETISPYPFASSSPTINIESDTDTNTEQGYLYNVVPQELDPSHPVAAVKAQAVATCSFAY